MKSSLFYISLLLAFLALPAFAETSVGINDSVSVDSVSTTKTTIDVSVDFSDEGLDDEDLKLDLEAEALPTTNNFAYRWEKFRNNIQSVFTFNAQKKAAHYRFRLHRLDRKLAACAEIGDEQCINKIEEHKKSLEERADSYIAKRQELQQQLLDRFDQWRTDRNARIEDLKQRAAERRAKIQELKEQRGNRREKAKENWQERRKKFKQRRFERHDNIQNRRQDRRENIQEHRRDRRQDIQEIREQRREDRRENRQDTIEQRQQNREQLIEMRSPNLKNKLDTARDQVELRNQELEETITE